MNDTRIATLAGGCFWCLEAAFSLLRGVDKVVSGYMGGGIEQPSYEQVCGGESGHAEVVQVHFDDRELSYGQLLEVFFTVHDPTTLNRQGNDVGSQYRSAIFFHDEEQREIAESVIARLLAEQRYAGPIVTEVEAAGTFWPAEAYHRDYFRLNPQQPYCHFVVAPKVAKVKTKFAAWLR